MKLIVPLMAILVTACAARAPDCDPQRAWDRASAGLATAAGCENDPLWREASNLGAHYHRLRGQYDALMDADRTAAAGGTQRLEQIRLERELNAVRGAAQVRGWLPPQLP